jgi:hypothetical protein
MMIAALVMLCGLVSCNGFSHQGKQLQDQLLEQQKRADEMTSHFLKAVMENNVDTLYHYVKEVDDVLMFVYYEGELVYWTSSWLSDSFLPLEDKCDVWQYGQWRNAHGVCKRTRVGELEVLAVIPIKYAYRVTSESLTNEFISPFKGESSWGVTRHLGDDETSYPIYSTTGEYLFSITQTPDVVEDGGVHHIENFSYQSLLASEKHEENSSRRKLLMYYGVALAIIFVLLFYALFHLVRSRGVRNMNLAGRLQMMLPLLRNGWRQRKKNLLLALYARGKKLSVLKLKKVNRSLQIRFPH